MIFAVIAVKPWWYAKYYTKKYALAHDISSFAINANTARIDPIIFGVPPSFIFIIVNFAPNANKTVPPPGTGYMYIKICE